MSLILHLNNLAGVTWQDEAWIPIWVVQLEGLVEVKCLAETHTTNQEQSWEKASLTEASRS